jgi:hypothetical protein
VPRHHTTFASEHVYQFLLTLIRDLTQLREMDYIVALLAWQRDLIRHRASEHELLSSRFEIEAIGYIKHLMSVNLGKLHGGVGTSGDSDAKGKDGKLSCLQTETQATVQ